MPSPHVSPLELTPGAAPFSTTIQASAAEQAKAQLVANNRELQAHVEEIDRQLHAANAALLRAAADAEKKDKEVDTLEGSLRRQQESTESVQGVKASLEQALEAARASKEQLAAASAASLEEARERLRDVQRQLSEAQRQRDDEQLARARAERGLRQSLAARVAAAAEPGAAVLASIQDELAAESRRREHVEAAYGRLAAQLDADSHRTAGARRELRSSLHWRTNAPPAAGPATDAMRPLAVSQALPEAVTSSEVVWRQTPASQLAEPKLLGITPHTFAHAAPAAAPTPANRGQLAGPRAQVLETTPRANGDPWSFSEGRTTRESPPAKGDHPAAGTFPGLSPPFAATARHAGEA